MKKQKIISDVLLNIIASALPTFFLQLLLLPLISRQLADDALYGQLITIVSLCTILSSTFGSSLNNTRLLLDGVYREQGQQGDFNLLTALCGVLCFAATAVGAYFYQVTSFSPLILIGMLSVLNLFYHYYSVAFRLEINYKKVLACNLLMVAGYFLGYFVFLKTSSWQWVYLVGYSAALLYTVSRSRLICEPWKTTPLLKATSTHLLILLAANFLASSTNYIDRLLLYPLLGGAAVSIYYVSTIFGKMISMVISPISSVMLSYFSKMDGIKKRSILQIFFSSCVVGALGYVFCILISPFLLSILYPDLAQQAEVYIYINTFTAILSMLCSVLNPIAMKFRKIIWQIALHGVSLLIYVVAGLFLLQRYGLMGFCVGLLLATAAKLVLLLVICLRTKQPPQCEESV